jgi:hypothetical protein
VEKRLVGGDAPGDEGAIFSIAIGLELEGYESATSFQVLSLKDVPDTYGETTSSADLFGWARRAWRWVRGNLEDGWRFVKRQWNRIDWECLGATAAIGATCAGCVASVVLAPESGGTSLTAAKWLCGAGCVGAAIDAVASGKCQ